MYLGINQKKAVVAITPKQVKVMNMIKRPGKWTMSLHFAIWVALYKARKHDTLSRALLSRRRRIIPAINERITKPIRSHIGAIMLCRMLKTTGDTTCKTKLPKFKVERRTDRARATWVPAYSATISSKIERKVA
jgi:hypothetical protein